MKRLKYTPKNILLTMGQAYTFISTHWPMHQITLNTSKDLIDIYQKNEEEERKSCHLTSMRGIKAHSLQESKS
jgi:hypothetical protein